MDRSRAHFAMDANGMPGLLQSSSSHRPPNEVALVFRSFDGIRSFGFGAVAWKPSAQASTRSSGMFGLCGRGGNIEAS